MEVIIDITEEVANYSVNELIKLLQFLQKNGFNRTCFDGYDASICLIRGIHLPHPPKDYHE